MTLRADAAELLPDLVRLRRAIHADPELGLSLPRTQGRILDALAGLGLDLSRGHLSDSVVAVLRGAHEGPAVLLRADMDALPLVEDNELEYRACGDAMHACGHDLHVAGLVGAARLLSARRDDLHGDVVFMFQPGEEVGDGARLMVEEGVLEAAGRRVDAAYAVHIVPGEPGVFSTKPGALMAGALELEVTVRGRGGHASAPHLAADPVPVVAELVTAFQTFVTRRFDALDPVVLTVTRLAAGGPAYNVIEATASLGASIRVLSDASLARMQAELPRLIEGLARAHGCEVDVRLELLCPPTTNDDSLGARALQVLTDVFGADRVRTTPAPVMGSEDFSYVSREVPAVYFFLRATPPGIDPAEAAPNHTPQVRFDDAVLGDQAAALAALALSHLGDA